MPNEHRGSQTRDTSNERAVDIRHPQGGPESTAHRLSRLVVNLLLPSQLIALSLHKVGLRHITVLAQRAK